MKGLKPMTRIASAASLMTVCSFAAHSGTILKGNWVKQVIFLNEEGTDSLVNTVYYDGLGRECQRVGVKASPTAGYMVERAVYGANGLPVRKYLPGVSHKAGAYADDEDIGYWVYEVDRHTYTITVYEASPLHRAVEVTGPGDDWHQRGRSSTSSYCLNSATAGELLCRVFTCDFTPDTGWPFKVRSGVTMTTVSFR